MLNAMKNTFSYFRITLTTLTLAILTPTLYAQQNAIRITPLQPVIGKFSIDYERAIAPRTTIMAEYQRWFENRSSGVGLLMFGIPAASWNESHNEGFRFSTFVRHYSRAAMKGGFVEGGVYFGSHDITTRTETSIINPEPVFIFNLWQTSVEETRYENVRMYGLRLGGGWHKVIRNFSLEFSGGFNLNANPSGVETTLGMKPFAPYSRFALGVGF
jgi:hypothetical protein